MRFCSEDLIEYRDISDQETPADKISYTMLDIKSSADYLSRSTGSFSNFSMLFGT